jgi:hypothetical protein
MARVVSVDELMAMAVTQVDHPYSGHYDQLNGNHPWAFWCLAYVESTHRNSGLSVPPQASAVVAAGQFDLQPGPAPRGAAIFFGTSFYYPDGHVGLSCGDGTCLGTLTDGRGVGVTVWNERTVGYLGWTFYPGVAADADVADDPPPATWYVQPNNPHQHADQAEIGIGGAFLRYYQSVANGQEPLTVLGYARAREADALITETDGRQQVRTIQRFERLTLIHQPEHAYPWDVVAGLYNQTIDEGAIADHTDGG